MIELSELRDAAQKAFPADKLVPDRDASWQLVAEMGWLMIELPEELGGLGLGSEATATIHYEMGRVLSSAPLIPALLGLAGIAASSELADREDWAARICGGEYVPLHMLPAKLTAGAEGALSGTVSGVFEGDMASHVLVSAPQGYVLVPTDAAGVGLIERPIWDHSRRLFDLVLDGYHPDPALTVASGDAVKPMHDALSRRAQLAIAADSLGGASAALDSTVEYLKMRKQFDRPLAMFQALKHRCAEQKIAIGAAEALLWARARDEDARLIEVIAMRTLASQTYVDMVEEMIQLHGGIGLTDEHQSHLFMKRAMLSQQLCGSPNHWREAVGRDAVARL